MGKISDKNRLQKRLEDRDHFATIKFLPHLELDTSKTTEIELSTRKIIEYYNLTEIK